MADRLTIVTFNLFHDLPQCRRLDERLGLLARAIAAEQPDLAALQELARAKACGDIGSKLARMVAQECGEGGPSYRLDYAPADGSGEGEWRFDEGLAAMCRSGSGNDLLAQPEVMKFKAQVRLSATVGGISYRLPDDRIAIRTRHRLSGGGMLEFFATHLTDRAERDGANDGDGELIRLRQAHELIGWIRAASDPKAPVIVAGDLNDVPDSAAIGAFLKAGFIDTYARAGAAPGYTNDRGDLDLERPAATHNQRIDYLLLRPGRAGACDIVEARRFLDRPCATDTGWLWPSDHIGVLARLKL